MIEVLTFVAVGLFIIALVGPGWFLYWMGRRDEIRLIKKELAAGRSLPKRLFPDEEGK